MRTLLLYALFLGSGAAGLIYELVWVRELIFVFGGTTYAITTVLVAFMAGLGLGSFFAGRWCHRLHQPGRVYGVLEIAIGLYALSVPFLLTVAVPVYRGLYPHLADWPWLLNFIRFLIGGLILIIPTTCMGATLPVLVRHVTMHGRLLGRSVGYLYGINAFGAVLGTLAAGFVLIPGLGLLHATWFAATLNIVIGIIAINLFPQSVKSVEPAPAHPAPRATPVTARLAAAAAPHKSLLVQRLVLVGFAVSGFAAMVYQITWARSLVMAVGSTTYAFTCILAAFILGLSLGSLAIARWADRWKNPVLVFGVLELLIGLVAVVIVPIQGRIPLVVEMILEVHHANYAAVMAWQFLLIIAITFVPTFLMGAIFPLVIRALAAKGDDPAAATGRAYVVNTIGTIAGSFLAGFVLIRSEVLGVQNSIILASLLNGLVGLALVALARPGTMAAVLRRAIIPAVAVVLILGIGIGAGRWDPHILTAAPFMMRGTSTAPRDIIYYGEGMDVTVSVEHPKDAPLSLTLRVNGKPDASTSLSDMVTMLLLGHLPTLVAPEAKSACMVGLGSGLSLGALACHPSFERLDCVEIADEVVKAAAFFAPFTYDVLERDPRTHLILADGRNHLLLTDRTYDLVITQPSNPWMSGVANLFTREYFELGKGRLSENGVMAVWLQGYKTSVTDFQMIVRTLFDVFDHVSLWGLGEQDFLMLASQQPQRIDYADFERRFRTPTVRADLYRVSIRRPADILARYIASDEPLRNWVRAAPIHTDNNALLEFSAPRHMYEMRQDVGQALLPLQGQVLSELVVDRTLPPGLEVEIARAANAYRAPARAALILSEPDQTAEKSLSVLRLLLDAYDACPRDAQLFQFLIVSRNRVRVDPSLAGQPEVAATMRRLDSVQPPPPGAPPTGATLGEIASHMRSAAAQVGRQGRWDTAALYLSEAHDLEPNNIDTALALADALQRANHLPEAAGVLDQVLRRRPEEGRVAYARAVLAAQSGDLDTALTHLATALKWGAVTQQTVTQDERLRALHQDPRFQALVTPPESRPAQ